MIEFIYSLKYYVISFTNCEADAEDILQDVLLKVLLRENYYLSKPFEEQKKIVTKSIRNLYYDREKVGRNKEAKKERYWHEPKVPNAEVVGKIELKETFERLERINVVHRSIMLAFVSGFKCREIAEKMDLRINTVLGALRYARAAISEAA